jgi:hypothetical protein
MLGRDSIPTAVSPAAARIPVLKTVFFTAPVRFRDDLRTFLHSSARNRIISRTTTITGMPIVIALA